MRNFRLQLLHARTSDAPVPRLSDANAPLAFKRPSFGATAKREPAESSLNDVLHRGGSLGVAINMIFGQLQTKSADLMKYFPAGPRNSIGGGANQYNTNQTFEIGKWAWSQAVDLAESQTQVAGRGAGEIRFWQTMQELRTLAMRGFAFGSMFGSEAQRDRSVAAFAADFLEAGMKMQLEPTPGIHPLLNRYHLGFFSIHNADLAPRNYAAFTAVVSGIADRVRATRTDLAVEVGGAIAALPDKLFSGKQGTVQARETMIKNLIAIGERLRLGSSAA